MAYNELREHLELLKRQGVDSVVLSGTTGARLRELLENEAPTPQKTAATAPIVAQTPTAVIPTAPAAVTPKLKPALPVSPLIVAEPVATFNEPMPRSSNLPNICDIPATPLPKGDKKKQWDWLREHVLTNPDVLKHVRKGVQPVFGVGNLDSPIFFCGEAPGADEEEQGEPFVGRAGQLLTKIIEAMGFKRSDVYIANILNWRPEKENMEVGNRPPTLEEMMQCIPYLKAQVNIVQPKAIIALGATAVTGLFGHDPDRRMGASRGKFFDFCGTPVMVTYHPSYLLRNQTMAAKRQVWEDILLVMKKVGLKITEKQEKYFT